MLNENVVNSKDKDLGDRRSQLLWHPAVMDPRGT